MNRKRDQDKRQAVIFILAVLAFYMTIIDPGVAANIDLSPIADLLQGIAVAFTGSIGKSAATVAIVCSLLGWFFGSIDFRQLFWFLVAIVGIGSAATIVNSLWSAP